MTHRLVRRHAAPLSRAVRREFLKARQYSRALFGISKAPLHLIQSTLAAEAATRHDV
jgi:hypothetical protein